MSSRQPWTATDLRTVAAALHGSPQGALAALARQLGENPRLVRRWAAGTTPIPEDIIARLEEIIGTKQPLLETAWRRDEWVIADGKAMDRHGHRREYIIHLWPPRFRCRAIATDPDSGVPMAYEQPVDLSGLVYADSDVTILAEFEWQDRPPKGDQLVLLLEAACDALDESGEGPIPDYFEE